MRLGNAVVTQGNVGAALKQPLPVPVSGAMTQAEEGA